MNRTVTQSWLIYLQIFEVRAELTKTVVVKVFEILESARIYVSISSTLGTKGKHVTRCEPQIFSEQSQPLNAKLSQLTPLLVARAITVLQCNQWDNHIKEWLSHQQKGVQLKKRWQDHMRRSLLCKSERALGHRQQMEPVQYSCRLLDVLTDKYTASNEDVRELISRKRSLKKNINIDFFWSGLAEHSFLCQAARYHAARIQ